MTGDEPDPFDWQADAEQMREELNRPTCRMADPPDWPGRSRVCPHGAVIASGGQCHDQASWAEVFEQRAAEWDAE